MMSRTDVQDERPISSFVTASKTTGAFWVRIIPAKQKSPPCDTSGPSHE